MEEPELKDIATPPLSALACISSAPPLTATGCEPGRMGSSHRHQVAAMPSAGNSARMSLTSRSETWPKSE